VTPPRAIQPWDRTWARALQALIGLLTGTAVLLLAGCGNLLQRPVDPNNSPAVSGRLAVTIEARERQTFSGEFELNGSPAAGSLLILGPLGQTLVEATWTSNGAQLLRPRPERQFDNMDTLTEQTLGAPLPVPALMQWLTSSKPTPLLLPGWQLDDTQREAGRLAAVRTHPSPRVELRLILELRQQ
jgi:outer membrane biogenesis lipoprotein LolB